MKRVSDILIEHQKNLESISLSFIDYRCYGDGKIKRPKILKGLKPIHKIQIIGKNADIYKVDDTRLVLHFRELFCKQATFPDVKDMELPTSALAVKYGWNRKFGNKFIYPDAWCIIHNRNEGYVQIDNLQPCFRELYGLRIAPIVDKVYKELRELSLKDGRFLTLGIEPIGADSCDYYRFSSDLVEYFYKQFKNKIL